MKICKAINVASVCSMLLWIVSCSASRDCQIAQEYASKVLAGDQAQYEAVQYLHKNQSSTSQAQFMECFVTAYGEGGLELFYEYASASLSSFYAQGESKASGLKAGSLDSLAFVLFVVDSVSESSELGFKSGFYSSYGDFADKAWESLIGMIKSGPYISGRTFGDGLINEKTEVVDIVQYCRDSLSSSEESPFMAGFAAGFGGEGDLVCKEILVAAKSDWYDEGKLLAHQYINDELQSWQMTGFFSDRLRVTTRPNYISFKAGFIAAFDDLAEGKRTFDAIEGGSR